MVKVNVFFPKILAILEFVIDELEFVAITLFEYE